MRKQTMTLYYGAALIAGDMTTPERLKILSKYLNPPPGQELRLDEHVVKEFSKKDKERGVLYGTIEVSPPKGQCFTVTRDVDRPDTEICKKTSLRWQLGDLDRHTGKLTWSIKTGPGDFGTMLEWNTRYSIAKIIPAGFEFNEANSSAMFIKSCDAVAADPGQFIGRRVKLSFFNGEEWIIRFPEKDEPLPAFEPPPPPPTEEEIKAAKKAADKAAEHGGGHDEKPAPPPVKAPPPPPPEGWTMSTRRGFVMDINQVIAGGATMPSKTKGKCRYQYDGTIGDDNTGRIECHYHERFLYFYAPLTCLKFIKPKS